MPNLNTKQAILMQLHQLPMMPVVVHEVIRSISDEHVGSALLTDKIALDQGLSARVLRVSNSSFYGLAREIGSIRDAIMVLGFDTVRSLVVTAGAMQTFEAKMHDGFDRQAYWLRCLRVATYADSLTRSLGVGRQLSFTAGLFHEVGQLVLSICIPEQFNDVLAQQQATGEALLDVEHALLGFDHAEIGAALARSWNFPSQIEQAIHYWREPEHEPFEPVAGLVYVAVQLERGWAGADLLTRLPDTLCERLQLDWERITPFLPPTEQLEDIVRLIMTN